MWRPFPQSRFVMAVQESEPTEKCGDWQDAEESSIQKLFRIARAYGYAGELADRREEAAVEAESCDRECLSQYRATVLDVRARETA